MIKSELIYVGRRPIKPSLVDSKYWPGIRNGDPPYDADEYEVAGGIAGKPVGLVKCKRVDIEGIYRKILTT